GPHDWAPYAANGIVLALIFWAIYRTLRRESVPPAPAAIIVIALALTPFIRFSITEFRPDIFFGLLLALGVLWLVDEPVFRSPAPSQFKLGFYFGIVLLSKPSVFPATAVFLGLSAVVSTLSFLRHDNLPLRKSWLAIAKCFGILALGALLLFVPYLYAH